MIRLELFKFKIYIKYQAVRLLFPFLFRVPRDSMAKINTGFGRIIKRSEKLRKNIFLNRVVFRLSARM